MHKLKFKADIKIIGINPFVFVPEKVLSEIFKQAQKDKSPIPVIVSIDKNHLSKRRFVSVAHGGYMLILL